MYNIIKGDATNPAGLGTIPIVIPHLCNDQGAWGKGFVLAVTKAFGGDPERAYKAWARNDGSYGTINPKNVKYGMHGSFVLGETQFVKIEREKLVVANMVAQHGLQSQLTPELMATRPPIRYGALAKCMGQVSHVAQVSGAQIHCPKFGSDLAGGNWTVISELIQELWCDKGLDVTVYEFPKQ
jgi:hypothetical protein